MDMFKMGATYKDTSYTEYNPFENMKKIPIHFTFLDSKEGFYKFIQWSVRNNKMDYVVRSTAGQTLTTVYNPIEVPHDMLPLGIREVINGILKKECNKD